MTHIKYRLSFILKKQKVINILFFSLLFIGTTFVSMNYFVNPPLQTKNYFFAIIILSWTIFLIFYKKREINSANILTLSLSALIVLLILRSIKGHFTIRVIFFVCFLLLYLICKELSRKETRLLDIMIPLVCSLQAVYGLLQYTGVIQFASQFKIIGSFDNPAGFAACLSTGIFFSFRLIKDTSLKLKYLGSFSFSINLIGIILSASRTGLISVVLVLIIYLFIKYTKNLSLKRKMFISFVTMITIILFSVFLFTLKKDSAKGRLLIWSSTAKMISEKPIFGAGGNSFKRDYMLYQGNFFENNPDSKLGVLADNVIHPFNEYLLLTAEYGLIGFIALVFIILIVFRHNKNSLSVYYLSLLSILLFSLFSYPFRYPVVWVLLAYNLSQLSHQIPSVPLTKIIHQTAKLFIISISVISFYFVFKDINFEYKWNKLAKRSISGNNETELLMEYQNLYNKWNGNPLFLYNYGAELNYREKYNESTFVLKQCEKFYNDYDIQIIIADNYLNTQFLDEARKHYMVASNMIPNRFIPLYQLMNVYKKQEETKKMLIIAHKILKKGVKIPSSTVSSIKKEASKTIKNHEAFN